MRSGAFQVFAGVMVGALIPLQAWADQEKPDFFAHQVFDTTVTCNAIANNQDRWNAPKINELVAKKGSVISGRMQLLEAVPKAEYVANVGLIAQGVDKRHFSELAFYDCENGQSVCALASHIWSEERRQEQIPISGIFSRKVKIPLRIHFNGPRQWVIDYGGKSATLNFPYDVGALQVRCVSGKGWASFDLPRELTS